MKRNFIAMLATSAVLASSSFAYADTKDDRIKELEAQVEELQSIIDDLKEQLEKYTTPSDKDVYEVGDTWTVAGQWTLTVDSVEEIEDRNQFTDKNPSAVYLITYTYENVGYEDQSGAFDGIYLDLTSSATSSIVDVDGKMAYSYPAGIKQYPQETPVGAKCEAQACVGVDNPGDFKIYFSKYDGNKEKQEAVFSFEVEQSKE